MEIKKVNFSQDNQLPEQEQGNSSVKGTPPTATDQIERATNSAPLFGETNQFLRLTDSLHDLLASLSSNSLVNGTLPEFENVLSAMKKAQSEIKVAQAQIEAALQQLQTATQDLK